MAWEKPLVLAFNTSGPFASVAIADGWDGGYWRDEPMRRGQAERLFPLAEQVLDEAGLGWSDIDALAAATGPGNFTGIRISVSAIRGLAMSLGRPAFGVSSFEALRHKSDSTPTITSLSAPRGQLYLQFHRPGEVAESPILADPDHLPPDWIGRYAVCIGDDARQVARAIGGRAETSVCDPNSAISIANVAWDRFSKGVPGERPTPLYIRPADAAPASDPPPVILP